MLIKMCHQFFFLKKEKKLNKLTEELNLFTGKLKWKIWYIKWILKLIKNT